MGITTVTENFNRCDTDTTRHADRVSKGFGVCTTCVERGTVLGQDLFGVSHNLLKRRTGKKFRATFLPGMCCELSLIEAIEAHGLMFAPSHDLDASGECYQRLSIRNSV